MTMDYKKQYEDAFLRARQIFASTSDERIKNFLKENFLNDVFPELNKKWEERLTAIDDRNKKIKEAAAQVIEDTRHLKVTEEQRRIYDFRSGADWQWSQIIQDAIRVTATKVGGGIAINNKTGQPVPYSEYKLYVDDELCDEKNEIALAILPKI